MKKKNIRILFLLIFPFLFLQLLVGKVLSESYPSVIFPSFAKKKEAYRITFDNPECSIILNSGDTLDVSNHQMWGDIPTFLHERLLRNKMKDAAVMAQYSDSQIDDFRSYLRGNLVASTGQEDLSAVIVKWYDYRLTKDGLERTFDRTYNFELSGE